MSGNRFPGMTLFRTFMLRHEGELARSALEARGFKVFLDSDDCGSVHPALGLATGGPKLYVEEGMLEDARAVLDDEFSDA